MLLVAATLVGGAVVTASLLRDTPPSGEGGDAARSKRTCAQAVSGVARSEISTVDAVKSMGPAPVGPPGWLSGYPGDTVVAVCLVPTGDTDAVVYGVVAREPARAVVMWRQAGTTKQFIYPT